MARHNDVILYGYVQRAPDIYLNEVGEKKVCKGMAQLLVVKDYRKENTIIDKINYQTVLVISGNKEQVHKMQTWKQGDMVLVKGAVTTKDVNKKKTCSFCGKANIKPGTVEFVNPIWSDVIERDFTPDKAAAQLRDRSEISNKIMVMGELCNDPMPFMTSGGTLLTTYQLSVSRKYRVKDANAMDRIDFPWVKTYGRIAQSNLDHLKKGSLVLIDGYLQTRKIVKNKCCDYCGKTFEWPDTSMDVVPYSVEFLKNYRTSEEITDAIKKEHRDAIKKIFEEDELDGQ